jgi:hypothetical protein
MRVNTSSASDNARLVRATVASQLRVGELRIKPRRGARREHMDNTRDKRTLRLELARLLGGFAGPAILNGWSLLNTGWLLIEVMRDDHSCPYLEDTDTGGEGVACAVCDEKAERLRAIVCPEGVADDELEAEPEAA